MGAFISNLLLQPLLLGTAIAMMGIGLYYKDRKCNGKKTTGKQIFKINVGVAIVIIILAILINFISVF